MVSTAAIERPAAARTARRQFRVGETVRTPASRPRPRPAGCPPGRHRPRPPGATSASDSTRCSTPTGVTGPSAVVITWTSRPSIHSRPSASRWPTSPVRCQPGLRELQPFGRPQLVVAILHVGARPRRPRRSHPAGRSVRRQPTRRPPAGSAAISTPGTRPADADPVAGARLLDLGQRDVGDRQRLGHPVRGVQLGARQQLPGPGAAARPGRCAGRHQPAGPGPGRPAVRSVSAGAGRHHVAQRGGRGEDHRGRRRRRPRRRARRRSGCRARSRPCRAPPQRRRGPGRRARTARRPRPAGRPGRDPYVARTSVELGQQLAGAGRPRPSAGRSPRT